jgi:hypothetical protein
VENSDDPLRPLVTGTNFVTDQILKRQELDVINELFANGHWSSSATPSPLWSDDTSDPLGDIETGINTVEKAIGRVPNVGVIGRGLWRYLKNHPDVLERLKYGGNTANPAYVTAEGIAALVGLEKLLVARSIYDTAAEGKTSTLAYMAGDSMWVGYVAAAASLDTPSAGYVFTWKTRTIERFREEQEHADVVECRASWDVQHTAADAAYLIYDAA